MTVVYRERTGMTVQQIVSKWPEKVLTFLWREGFFEESLTLVGITVPGGLLRNAAYCGTLSFSPQSFFRLSLAPHW